MLIVRSCNDVPIRLIDERWLHIVRRHPEMEHEREKVLEVVTEPDLIQQGDFGELLAIRHYPQTTLTSKFIVVAYREIDSDDGFIVTAYQASQPSGRRKVVWRR